MKNSLTMVSSLNGFVPDRVGQETGIFDQLRSFNSDGEFLPLRLHRSRHGDIAAIWSIRIHCAAATSPQLPLRFGTEPSMAWAVAIGPRMLNSGSKRDKSTTCPSQNLVACAYGTQCHRARPAIISASASGGSSGSRSAKPVIAAKPDIPSIRLPNPGLA